MKEMLSRVYLDDYPITLMGDEATPPLSRVVRAGGKHPDRVDVLYLTSPGDKLGRSLGPEEVIDRTAEPTRPIYLRTVDKVKPIRTADPGPGSLFQPDRPEALASRAPMPNLDPVISQLGGRPPDAVPDEPKAEHEEAVFRSPSQGPPASASPVEPPVQAASTPAASAAPGLRAIALARAANLAGLAAAQKPDADKAPAGSAGPPEDP